MIIKPINCPNCQNIMEKGSIPCDRYALSWVPEGKFKFFPFSRHYVKLNNMLDRADVDAYLCRECKLVIMTYE